MPVRATQGKTLNRQHRQTVRNASWSGVTCERCRTWQEGTPTVLRLLRGEPLEALSRELGVEAHRPAAWSDDFLDGGKEALEGQRPDRSPDDRAFKQAEPKIGQLTMENEMLRAAAERRG